MLNVVWNCIIWNYVLYIIWNYKILLTETILNIVWNYAAYFLKLNCILSEIILNTLWIYTVYCLKLNYIIVWNNIEYQIWLSYMYTLQMLLNDMVLRSVGFDLTWRMLFLHSLCALYCNYYHWVDTSASGLLVYRGIISSN